MTRIFSLSLLSLKNILDDFFHLDSLLFLYIFLIFLQINDKSSSLASSYSYSSSEELSTLTTFDDALGNDLDDEGFLVLWTISASDFPLFPSLSCWSSIFWTLRIPISSSIDRLSRFFDALSAVSCGLHCLGKLLKILSIWYHKIYQDLLVHLIWSESIQTYFVCPCFHP